MGSFTGHIKVDHAIKVCHFHLPPIRTGAVVNGLMRALRGPLQEDVGGCYTEKADNVVDICLLYISEEWLSVHVSHLSVMIVLQLNAIL